jgi:hypothetical protein
MKKDRKEGGTKREIVAQPGGGGDPRKLDNFDVTSAKQLSPSSTSPDVGENQLSGPKVQPASSADPAERFAVEEVGISGWRIATRGDYMRANRARARSMFVIRSSFKCRSEFL